MIYQKHYNTKYNRTSSGSIMFDILMALAMGAIFVAIITQSSIGARDLFAYSKNKSQLLGVFSKNIDLFRDALASGSSSIAIGPSESERNW